MDKWVIKQSTSSKSDTNGMSPNLQPGASSESATITQSSNVQLEPGTSGTQKRPIDAQSTTFKKMKKESWT